MIENYLILFFLDFYAVLYNLILFLTPVYLEFSSMFIVKQRSNIYYFKFLVSYFKIFWGIKLVLFFGKISFVTR